MKLVNTGICELSSFNAFILKELQDPTNTVHLVHQKVEIPISCHGTVLMSLNSLENICIML